MADTKVAISTSGTHASTQAGSIFCAGAVCWSLGADDGAERRACKASQTPRGGGSVHKTAEAQRSTLPLSPPPSWFSAVRSGLHTSKHYGTLMGRRV